MMKQVYYVSIVIYIFIISSHYISCEQFKITDQIYFDIDSDGKYIGRIVVGLFGETVPRTARNFKLIATNGINGKTYEGSKFHRVVERFLIQGGDILYNNGSGAISIYGKKFKDENFKIKHNSPGVLSMANTGKNANGCQFFITTMSATWLDGHHVAFGKVLYGQDVVHKIEHMKTDSSDQPITDVIIRRSGLLPTTPFYEPNEPYELSLWAWFKAGWFPLSFSFGLLIFFQWIMAQLK